MNNIRIWCDTEEELHAVLDKMHKEGFRHVNLSIPASSIYEFVAAPAGVITHNKRFSCTTLRWWFDQMTESKEMSAEEYLGKGNDDYRKNDKR